MMNARTVAFFAGFLSARLKTLHGAHQGNFFLCFSAVYHLANYMRTRERGRDHSFNR